MIANHRKNEIIIENVERERNNVYKILYITIFTVHTV